MSTAAWDPMWVADLKEHLGTGNQGAGVRQPVVQSGRKLPATTVHPISLEMCLH